MKGGGETRGPIDDNTIRVFCIVRTGDVDLAKPLNSRLGIYEANVGWDDVYLCRLYCDKDQDGFVLVCAIKKYKHKSFAHDLIL